MWINQKFVSGFSALLFVSSLSGCSADSLNNLNGLKLPQASSIPAIVAQASQFSRQRVHVAFFTQLSNGELVPLSPDKLESIKFNDQFEINASAYPQNKGLEQSFPFIEAGQHVLSLKFIDLEQPVLVPIDVRENEVETLEILVKLAFGESQIKRIRVGQDQDLDRNIDKDSRYFESFNGQDFRVIEPDGREYPWVSPLETADEAPNSADTAPVTPGIERDSEVSEAPPTPINEEPINNPEPLEVPEIPEPPPPQLPPN